MSPKRVVVTGNGPGQHNYEIAVAGRIHKGTHAGSNDTTNRGGLLSLGERVDGEVWNWNADSYLYFGELVEVEADGDVSVHFPDGAYESDTWLAVTGQEQGRHDYSVSTNSGDIDPHPASTSSGETDHGSASSENKGSPDHVSGYVLDQNSDGHELVEGTAVQSLSVENGHIAFNLKTSKTFDQGEASIVFFYMGDSRFTTLFQEGTRLNQALKGYDEKVLLKHSFNPQSIHSSAAHNNADTVREPTRTNFKRELRRLTNAGYTIDLYIFSHGYDHGAFKMSNGSHGTQDVFDTGDVKGLSSSVAEQIPLRMVYQVNCWGSKMNSAWRDIGARAVAGSRYINFFPHQFEKFARRWRKGDPLREALDKSNTAASRSVVHTGLLADAAATKGRWGGCPVFKTILSNHSCAKNYYTDRWLHEDHEWDSSLSGKENINRASEKLVAGSEYIDNSVFY